MKDNSIKNKLYHIIFEAETPSGKLFDIFLLITICLSVICVILESVVEIKIQYGDVEGLQEIILILVGLLIIHAGMQFLQSYMANWLGQSVILTIRRKLFNHVVSFKLKYFDTTPIGTLVTRVTSDIQTIAEVFSAGLLNIISDILQLIMVLAFMFYINWELTLIVLAPVPILIVATILFKRAIKTAFIDVRKNVAKINTFVQEHVNIKLADLGAPLRLGRFRRQRVELALSKIDCL